MKLKELQEFLASLPEEAEVVISLFKSNGMVHALPIADINEDFGIVHLETSEEEGVIY